MHKWLWSPKTSLTLLTKVCTPYVHLKSYFQMPTQARGFQQSVQNTCNCLTFLPYCLVVMIEQKIAESGIIKNVNELFSMTQIL